MIKQSANVRAIQTLGELNSALGRFANETNQAMTTIEREITRTLEWLQQRLYHWQREVERWQQEVQRARAELERCLRSGHYDRDGHYHPPNCAAYEQALLQTQVGLREAQAEFQNVQQWTRLVQQVISDYQRQARRFSALIQSDLPKATALLGGSVAKLESYAKLTLSASSAPPAPTTTGTRQEKRISDVSLEQVDLSDSPVKGPGDFQKVSYEEMKEGLSKLEEVVRPAVKSGANGDYFSRLDAELGLDYPHGYRRIYDAFYGDRPIQLVKCGDAYRVGKEGYHRLYVAVEMGLKMVPARVVEWTPSLGVSGSVTPPEFREGNIGGPERRG